MKQTWRLIVVSLLLVAFSTRCTKMDGPEAAAEDSFSEWAVNIRVPYKNESFKTIRSDDTTATVQITVELKLDGKWQEKQIELHCEKLDDEWQCDRSVKLE